MLYIFHVLAANLLFCYTFLYSFNLLSGSVCFILMWMFCRHVSNVNEIVLIIRRLFEHERPSLYVYTQVGRVMPLCCTNSLILHIIKLIMILDLIYLFRYEKQSTWWLCFTNTSTTPTTTKKPTFPTPTHPKKYRHYLI